MEVYHIKRAYLQKNPYQPLAYSFQQREIGGKLCGFRSFWFDDHKYSLEYSIKLEAAFCLCCYLFTSEIKTQRWIRSFCKKNGFKTWNKITNLYLHNVGTLPFRGHDESDDLINIGNFLEFLQFYVDRNDKVGSVLLKNAPKNSQMTCSSIQKDIVCNDPKILS
uniref:DUF4371 domain-containing protein n=1 Tax=Lactuca sativa TaxID=4236 RepID=A0A9R1XI70_LACSA|nr:hypothetical protein LSAT_V11C400185400 [Lactuca sativa]